MSIVSDIIIAGAFISVPQVLGFFATGPISSNSEHYSALNKPFWAPPSFVIRPAYTILYGILGISNYLIYTKGNEEAINIKLASLFNLVQLFFSFVWPTIFFKLKSNILALFIQALILLSSLTTVVIFEAIDSRAAQLVLPFLIWTIFIGYLNKVIWRRNQKGYINEGTKPINKGKFVNGLCSNCGTKIE